MLSSCKLTALLEECVELLEQYQEFFWSKKIRNILNELKLNGESSYLISNILSFYGGMGSFSDLLIMNVNGHNIKESDEDKVNKKLEGIREQIYEEAVSIKRSLYNS